MRRHTLLLMAATALCVASAASAKDPPFSIKSFDDFAIKSTDLEPTGCSLIRYTGSLKGDGGVITCSTQEQYAKAFVVSPSFVTVCKTEGEKYACTLTKP